MLPLISCLMVTLPVPARVPMLRRAIADYQRQTYPRRELVLVLNGGEPACHAAIRDHVAALADDSIRIVAPPGQLRVGVLRNVSIAAARGDILCQWDDDDFYHPERLARQRDFLTEGGTGTMLLRDVMQFFPAERAVFHTNWRATEAGGFPGSLMWCRDVGVRYPEDDLLAQLGEDTIAIRQLPPAHRPVMLAETPWLYVYISHGANSWPDTFHRMLNQQLAVSRGLLQRREAVLRQGLAGIGFGTGPVNVTGYNGVAFALEGAGETDISSV